MVKNLIQKIVLDAEKEAEEIVKQATLQLEGAFLEKKENILKEYGEKLETMKKDVDREIEKEISNFRIEQGKLFLESQNKVIKEVEIEVEKKFNTFLNNNMENIITNIIKETRQENVSYIKIPETSAEIKVGDIKVEKTPELKDAFIIQGKNWQLLFNWERFYSSIYGYIKEKSGEYLFGNNDKNKENRRT